MTQERWRAFLVVKKTEQSSNQNDIEGRGNVYVRFASPIAAMPANLGIDVMGQWQKSIMNHGRTGQDHLFRIDDLIEADCGLFQGSNHWSPTSSPCERRLTLCEALATALSDEDLVRHQGLALMRN